MPSGVYLHIPFCKSRCSYCDFATDVYRSADAVERYVEALCKEIYGFRIRCGNKSLNQGASAAELNPESTIQNPKSVDTVYFGGGTPSLLTPQQIARILETVNRKFALDSGSEITMEMNPATVTPESLRAYGSLGVNRASFGVQTFNDRALKLLARGHDARDARDTFRMLREAGFGNISFDLIAGLPGQSLEDWERNLDEALELGPEHLSLYLLEIHEGTPLAEQIRSGRQPVPDEDLAAAMYEVMLDRVAAAGYEQYEISNFAKPGYESRHNSKYWLLEPVYGFGVSAHSFDGRERYANDRDTKRYVSLIGSRGTAEVSREMIDPASEFAFLSLRLASGIDLELYRHRFGIDLLFRHAKDLERLEEAALIEHVGRTLRLTRRGMLFSNEVFAAFI